MMQILFAKLWYVQKSIDVFGNKSFQYFSISERWFHLFTIETKKRSIEWNNREAEQGREKNRNGMKKSKYRRIYKHFLYETLLFIIHSCSIIASTMMYGNVKWKRFRGKGTSSSRCTTIILLRVAMLLINIYPKLLIEMKEKQTPLPLWFEWSSQLKSTSNDIDSIFATFVFLLLHYLF